MYKVLDDIEMTCLEAEEAARDVKRFVDAVLPDVLQARDEVRLR